MSYDVYERAVKELIRETNGTPADRDWIKVVQLFDRLLDRGHSIHKDTLSQLCRQVGFDDFASDYIGLHYDILGLIRKELDNSDTPDYWRAERIERIISG